MHGSHCIKTWSTTQATVALSSAEAELYALLKTATQALGTLALARDLGITIGAKIQTDASATLGIVARQGLGKLRHIGVQYLWIQERVKTGAFALGKVNGAENPADLMTKHLAARDLEKHMAEIGCRCELSRAATAPQLSVFKGQNECPSLFDDCDYYQKNLKKESEGK